MPFGSWIPYCLEKYAVLTRRVFHSKAPSGIQPLHCSSFPPAPGYNSYRNLWDLFYTSATETTPDSNEVPFTSPKCSPTALFEDTKSRVKSRQCMNSSQWQWRALDHTNLKKRHFIFKKWERRNKVSQLF